MAHERAGQLAQSSDLIDIAELVTAYYTRTPDTDNPDQQVSFGTSGHRGSALDTAFNEAHILAITQAIVDYRAEQDGDTLTLQLRTVYNYAITVATDAGSETFLVTTEMD